MRNAIVFINICIVAAVSMVLLDFKNKSEPSPEPSEALEAGMGSIETAPDPVGDPDKVKNTSSTAGLSALGASSRRTLDQKEAAYVQDFIHEMRQTRKAAVEQGRLAAQRGTRRPLKDYGNWMAHHQQQMLDELDKLAKLEGVPIVHTLASDLTESLSLLEELHGRKFDARYIKNMITSLKADVSLLERASYSGDADIQIFAMRYLSVTKDNLVKLQKIRRDY